MLKVGYRQGKRAAASSAEWDDWVSIGEWLPTRAFAVRRECSLQETRNGREQKLKRMATAALRGSNTERDSRWEKERREGRDRGGRRRYTRGAQRSDKAGGSTKRHQNTSQDGGSWQSGPGQRTSSPGWPAMRAAAKRICISTPGKAEEAMAIWAAANLRLALVQKIARSQSLTPGRERRGWAPFGAPTDQEAPPVSPSLRNSRKMLGPENKVQTRNRNHTIPHPAARRLHPVCDACVDCGVVQFRFQEQEKQGIWLFVADNSLGTARPRQAASRRSLNTKLLSRKKHKQKVNNRKRLSSAARTELLAALADGPMSPPLCRTRRPAVSPLARCNHLRTPTTVRPSGKH
jgi:hypothetical protein